MPLGNDATGPATATGSRVARRKLFSPAALSPLAPCRRTARERVAAASLIPPASQRVDFDGRTASTRGPVHLLDHLLRGRGVPPGTLLPWRATPARALFVHRVKGLSPGLYLLERDRPDSRRPAVCCRSNFLWRRPVACPSTSDWTLAG